MGEKKSHDPSKTMSEYMWKTEGIVLLKGNNEAQEVGSIGEALVRKHTQRQDARKASSLTSPPSARQASGETFGGAITQSNSPYTAKYLAID